MGEQVQTNTVALHALSSVVSSIEEKITSLINLTKPPSDPSSSSPMVGKRSQQGATYAQIASSICPPPNGDTAASSQKPQRPLYDDIRESNVILFGLPEEKSIVETKAVVDEVFEFLAGRPVAIKDMFRLGKFRQSANPRPLLVKLSAIWDRKLLLVRKKNLREFRIGRLFLREDVPPDHRLRQRKSRPPNGDVVPPPTDSNDHVTQGASATSVTVAPANAPSLLQSSRARFSSPSHLISLTDSCSSSSTLSSATVVQDAADPV